MDLITPSGGLLFWMTLIFAIVFFLLAKFGFPVITGMIHKRQEHIEASLRDAASARESVALTGQTCEKMLEDARRQREALLDKARSEAGDILAGAREQSLKEAELLRIQTARELEKMKSDALKDMQNVVSDLAVTLSEKILRERLSDDAAQIELVEKLIDEYRDNS